MGAFLNWKILLEKKSWQSAKKTNKGKSCHIWNLRWDKWVSHTNKPVNEILSESQEKVKPSINFFSESLVTTSLEYYKRHRPVIKIQI